MRAGDKVRYVSGEEDDGSLVPVLAVTGTGTSLYKILSLLVDDAVVEKVPHENDAKEGEPHWREVGAARREVQVMPEPVPGGGAASGAPVLPVAPEVATTAKGTRERGGK